ncbi:unnamed protein product [Penicillium nalgiovense]|uniref:Major facilitator superfamily (MFS) profile domain-containing protein n=1 Tax=Penicillium nalgiovense TaxID=60175 RepID=A0A9W4N1F4_PENNA|nr:unnamed protein product [Penicillium nalgiovense]CAG7981514.1 unnamed protein product [Penicillium nalgiovense]CAG8137078.1 unnamed protein product [Penicillium nalgiovense]CAG8253127.1 unnamed protein product [Penicillium nalgiovense]CAG8257445.1 unnamed protein product [Penicillium nalgiovense]
MAPLEQIAILRSYIAMVSTMGHASGAPIGGLLTTLVGWRCAFLVQVPFVLTCLFMAAWKLPSRGRNERNFPGSGNKTSEAEQASLDCLGIGLLGIAISAFILLCRSVDEQFLGPSMTWVLVAVLIVSSILFLMQEILMAQDPLIPFKVMAKDGIGLACIMQTLLMFSLFAVLSNVAEFFVRTEYTSSDIVGLYQLPTSLGAAVGSVSCGYLIQRTGRYKTLAITSLVLSLVGFILIAWRWPLGPSHFGLVYLLCASTGAGGLLSTGFVGITAVTPQEHSPAVITTYYLAQQLGIILGVTAAATICRHKLRDELLQRLGTDIASLQVRILSKTPST